MPELTATPWRAPGQAAKRRLELPRQRPFAQLSVAQQAADLAHGAWPNVRCGDRNRARRDRGAALDRRPVGVGHGGLRNAIERRRDGARLSCQ